LGTFENHVEDRTKLLGKQQQDSVTVDFGKQIRVYFLHDAQGVVYVGRAFDQSLGRRLQQHTADRLNRRWNRFFLVRRLSSRKRRYIEDRHRLIHGGRFGAGLGKIVGKAHDLTLRSLCNRIIGALADRIVRRNFQLLTFAPIMTWLWQG
jgi:hypothetical protein